MRKENTKIHSIFENLYPSSYYLQSLSSFTISEIQSSSSNKLLTLDSYLIALTLKLVYRLHYRLMAFLESTDESLTERERLGWA
jgi:hypothetical protein